MSNNYQYHNTYKIEGLINGDTSVEITSSSNNNYTTKKKQSI